MQRLGLAAILPIVIAIVPLCDCSGGAPAAAAVAPAARENTSRTVLPLHRTFKFKTVVDPADSTFNELLGINDGRTTAGFYGSGLAGHPNQGYTAVPDFEQRDFTSENFPGSVQTQVTAINNLGDTAGSWVDGNGTIHGFIEWDGAFTSYDDPMAVGGTEILGLNDHGVAVGFYVGSSGSRNGFILDNGTFTTVSQPGATSLTLAGVNDDGDLAGYYSTGSSQSVGFLSKGSTSYTISYPQSILTRARGVNAHDAVVGDYVDAYGKQHGFVVMHPTNGPQWQSIDAPKGVGTTTINGVNDRVNMVGYYVDTSGSTDGVLVERLR